MAVKTFEEIYGSLSADEKKLLDNTFSKAPELKEGWLRQDDYSRKMNDLKKTEAEFEEVKAYKERMEPWAEQAWSTIHSLEEVGLIDKESGELRWDEKRAEYERQIEQERLKAVGGDMDPAELTRRVQEIVKANGGLTPDEYKAVVAEESRKIAAETFDAKYAEKETTFNEKTIPFVSGFSTSMALAAAKYERETGKEFTDDDTKAVFELMSNKKNYNPREMVAEYAKPHLQAKNADAEVERRVQEELAKRGMPGGGNEPYIRQDEKGNLQKMLDRSNSEVDFESVIRGKEVEAAKALRAEGK